MSITDKIISDLRIFLKRNSSTILTSLGVIGFIGTVILAIKETPKAIDILKNAEEEKGEKLTKMEVVKNTASIYIPIVVLGGSSIACVIGANILNKKQQASLASAYAFLNASYKQYKDKIKEVFGEEGHKRIEKCIMEDEKAYKNFDFNVKSSDIDEINEEVLFYDKYLDRYFKSTIKKFRDAEYDLNKNFYIMGYAELGDFYKLLELPDIPRCRDIGWSACWCPGIEFELTKANTDDGLECYIVEPVFPPEDYYINW